MSVFLLVVDIGNTNTKCGLVEDGKVSEVNRYSHSEDADSVFSALKEAYGPLQPTAVALASVVPDRTKRWRKELEQSLSLPVWELRTTDPHPIGVDVPKPETVGPDRLANAIAAVHRKGSPVMVADFGTALTFDVALPERGYVGGVIAPGIDLMYGYFAEKTALLPELSFEPCGKAIGSTTEEAMHSGAFFGYRGMVRELSAKIREEVGGDVPLLATGGYAAEVLEGFGEPVEVVPHLTLEGIGLAWRSSSRTA